MTEPKRLPFTTVTDSEKEKKSKKDPPTVRFSLSLNTPNEQQCSEFSYADLLKKSLGEKKPAENGDDPFGEDEDAEAMAAIAKKFEEKYNPKNTKWKKKHGRIQDYVDLGDGYDENDEFIDNSEAYDEVVPACLTTKLGGFYINCGKLDFKELSDDSDDDFKLGTLKKKKKKRRIESDSESDGEKKETKIKKRKIKDGIEGGGKKKKKLLNGEGKEFKKPKKPNPDKSKKKMSPTVAELLKQQTESTAGGESNMNGRLTPNVNSQSSQEGSSQDEGIDSVIDSVIAMSKGDKLDAVFDSVIGMTDSNSKDGNEEKKPESAPKLPDGLKPEFLQIIDKLKETAKSSNVSKGKFFNGEVSEMLLDIELTTRQLPCSQRSVIFGHLAWFLPCTKDTLLKRAKKLRLDRQEDQLKGPLQKLKDAIASVMPAQQEKHDAEFQIWKQKQAETDANKPEDNKPEGKDGDTEDSEEEGEKSNATNQEPTKKKVAAPKKKFEWNENLRALLCDVVRVKMKIYNYMKTRTQTAEEYLKTFIEREVKILWPKGWMQTSVLFKESRAGHVAWTNPPKIKKVPVINKTSISAANTPAMTPKQGITPSSAPLMVTKQGVTPLSAQGLSQKPVVFPGNTPVRPPGSGDAGKIIPTLLDYANDQSSSLAKSAADKMTPGNKEKTGSSVSGTSPGLSLLASSAASQKYIGDRSWDHVVSDILRSSLTSPTSGQNTNNNNSLAALQSESKKDSTFLKQFQNYASSVFQHQLVKDESKTSPTKSHQQHAVQSSLQIKPQDAHQMVQKLKAAQAPKQSPTPAHQKQVTNAQLASYLTQKAASGNITSLINQDAYKQFLESREKQISQIHHGDGKPKTVVTQRVNKPKTIVVHSGNSVHGRPAVTTKYSPPNIGNNSLDSAKKPTLMRSISQGSVSMQTGNQIQGLRISPTSAHISAHHVSPLASPGGGQRQSPSKSGGSYHSPHSVASLTSPSKGEATATNLLQSLFGQIDQAHVQQKSPSPSGGVNRTTPPQGKSSASPIWSMTSIVQTKPSNTSPSSYALPGMPKPVPGYQSIKLSAFNKETGGIQPPPHSPTMKSLLHNSIPQGLVNHPGNNFVPTSPILPGQPNANLQSQAGFFPPFTTQQSTYPYGTYYTGKSSNSSHGY
ncbi:ubinuclein-1-like isoform X1 [Mytilus trossulus]|uniref:ubinuclein-1-like isoform X1 n=1 Tax=Mytilus trossulus TaxID=6551 RepID=UPI003006F0C5